MRRTIAASVLGLGLLCTGAGPALATPPSTHNGCPPGYQLVSNDEFFGVDNTPKQADNVNHDGFVCIKTAGSSAGSVFIENLVP